MRCAMVFNSIEGLTGESAQAVHEVSGVRSLANRAAKCNEETAFFVSLDIYWIILALSCNW